MNPRPQHRLPWLGWLMIVGLLVSACVTVRSDGGSESPASTSPATAAASESPPGSESPSNTTSETPTAETGPPLIGYISLDERLPFARSVTLSVRAEAERAGVDIVECDSALTPQGALACARSFGEFGIDGLISFQAFPDIAADICLVSGSVPTVGVAFAAGPCEVSRLQLDQAESGRLAGDAMGRFARDRWDCAIDAYISLEASAAGADAAARMEGYRDGFEQHCRIRAKREIVLDGADRVATAETKVARALRRTKGKRLVVVGLNEDAIQGAMQAAAAAGRTSELYYSGQGADPSIRRTIACDPQYVVSVAHFPERYGVLVVPVLLDALGGEAVPAVIDAPLELMTRDDVRDVYPATPPCDE